ncbi:MAG: chromosomal replication initiator protein DnaA [Candidatus Taylorbacteria bacterium CG11_big_fil_rev_8_21_14_0_20_46_11]|uniref:Chromosomal replication initiator protein DnaA n=1 Tax=Candidatus Taylorbacteria bacterium CG11_big_fil_rev_8_21_14_0_20_46_11 TaxID=1975025 RepID=A0A2H0KBX6_9BACT|nr:MAG: chromosomal replication initiator protein DnaA [Candidatus Taylorbacteria bacterium CG11_big_fil_rev_8_21_14_0_20_46_11]
MQTTLDNKTLWESALTEIELSVSKANFTTWFKDTAIAKIEDGVVFIAVPNAFVKDWLFNKYHKFILRSLRNLAVEIRALEYLVSKEEIRKKEAERPHTAPPPPTSELPLQDYYIDKESNLNPRYTFESFVVGPFNELAYAASQAILKNPGVTYNPLFIYGSTGHGKTHLLQAVGNHIKTVREGQRVFYVSSEKFSQDFVTAMQNSRISQFKEKYRQYDVLIMDDIQFFSNKEKSQEELFHLFNDLYAHNKQIIFSSDKHPNHIQNLEERLKSRFAAGMIVDIPPPDRESRIAILKTKARLSSFALSDDVCEYIATVLEGNIRELEGILNSIIMQTQVKGRELSVLEVKAILKNTSKPKKALSIKDITKVVAEFYNIEENHIYEKTRRKEVVKPRQLVMYILREDCNVSFPLIGQKLGGRDHTTVIHSCEKIKNEIREDPNLLREIDQIRALL